MTLARRIVVGASGTPGSVRAMRYAAELAARSDATLVVVHAWMPPGGDMADRRAPSPILREVWQRAAGQRLRNCVDNAWGGMPGDVQTSLVIARGVAGEVLTDLASGMDDLLIVGAGRRGPLARIGHGRVTRYCMAHAACPVLAVPPATLASQAKRGLRSVFRHHGMSAEQVARELDQRAA
ncbi:MAG TPA: universal stress protein [Streptosporangiaceae bacterium]|nr:universal stress protein [Streptosporangiaceae bacterium]